MHTRSLNILTKSGRALLLFLSVAALAPLARADRAKDFYKQGQRAEVRKQYDAAFADYERALELKPNDVDYILAARRSRFEASIEHIRRGQQLRDQHRTQAAITEFTRALQLDPTNVIAAQELESLRQPQKPAQAPGEPVTPQEESSLDQRLRRAAGPAELGPISTTPINNFKLAGDARVAYDTLGKLAGLNILYDQNFPSNRVTLDLNNITLAEALRILGIESKTFYSVVTPNTIFVAEDNAQKRQEMQQEVIKTFYLHNLSQSGDLAELSQAIRALLGLQHFQPILSQMALVIRDTPDRVAVAQKIIDDLDKAPPEVIVDVEVLETSKDLVRDLGIAPGPSPLVTVGLNGTTVNQNTTNGTTTTPGSVTLNTFSHLSGRNFSVTISPITLNALLSDSRTKTLQTPQLRAMQAQKATLQIGDRIPIATGSFGGGFAGGIGGIGGINALVNTQFQYQNVGVNVDITPYIHGQDEVSLKTRIEISSVTGHVNIGSIDQPIIGQRVMDLAMIQLRDGESNVLGGILNEQDVHTLTGIPGLSQIPLFKWLSSTHLERTQDEILIVMTPHIVRRQMVTTANLRALDTGTERNVELHELPPAMLASPQPPAIPPTQSAPAPATTPPATVTQPGIVPGQPATAPPGTAPPGIPPQGAAPGTTTPPAQRGPTSVSGPSNVPGQGAALRFDPQTADAVAGTPFALNLYLNNADAAYAMSLQLDYDPRMLEVQNISNAGFLSSDGQAVAVVHRDDPNLGNSQVTITRPPNVGGISGSGGLITVSFRAKAAGVTTISVSRVIARNPSGQIMPISVSQATVRIR